MLESKALDIAAAKIYLRIDEDAEDSLIKFLLEFSKEEIERTTGVKFDSGGTTNLYKMAQLIIITDRYENRGSLDQPFQPNNSLTSLYTKLRYKAGGYSG